MADPRYSAGVKQGIALSRTPGAWPTLPQLGELRGAQPFSQCAYCADGNDPHAGWTFVRYGEKPVCKRHALRLADEARAGKS